MKLVKKQEVLEVILLQCSETSKSENISTLQDANENSKLYHPKSCLDSLGLVLFITQLEEKIKEKFHKDIIIVNEKAISSSTSPFLSVKTLNDYIFGLLTKG